MVKRPGILILSPFFKPNLGGVETHLNDLCDYLRTQGYRTYVITYQPLTTRARGRRLEKGPNLEIHRIPWFGHNWFHKLERYPLLQFLYLTPGLFICSGYFMLRNHRQVEVIHAHGLVAAFIARIIARACRKRAVMSTHAIYNLRRGSRLAGAIRWILSPFAAILTLSRQSQEELVNIGIQKERIRVYTYWVNQDLFQPLDGKECKRKIGWEGKFVVLFVGRFIEIKGVKTLLQAARSVKREINFAFLGDGPLSGEIQKTSSRSNILFTGSVNNEHLPGYYNAADLVIVPSRYQEGYGRVILEALSCGTPVIASDKGGIREALDSSVGWLIEPSVKGIKEKVEHLFDHPGEVENLARNCRRYAEKKFSRKNAQLIEKSYRNKGTGYFLSSSPSPGTGLDWS